MKSFIFLILSSCCLFSISAWAQYTCNDRGYLEQELAKLARDCGSGGGSGSICESRGYKGSNAERAVAACVKAGYNETYCNQGLSCNGIALCDSRGYKGGSLESAVAACVKAGYNGTYCNQGVACEGARVCTSRGYNGSTVESAVAACVKGGYNETYCNQGVSCQ